MKKFEIYGVSALLGVALTMGVASCSSSDPATDGGSVVTPVKLPEIVVNNTVSGVVTTMSGDPIKGAKVVMDDNSVTTGDEGTFSFEKVAVGSHNVDVSADGKISSTGSVTIDAADNGNHVLNFTLANEGKKLVVQEDGSQKGETETETLKGNDAAKIEVAVEAPADAVEVEEGEEEVEITVTPTYDADMAASEFDFDFDFDTKAVTRADNGLFLVGSNIRCSNPKAKLKKPLALTYKVDQEMLSAVKAKKYKNGAWTDATVKETGSGTITISVDEFAPYALFCSATMTSAEGTTEPITFTKNTWDNTTGSSDLYVDKAEYTFKTGTDVQVQSDKVLAYLVELIVRATGAGLQTVKGSQPLNVTLPAGAALSISGVQAVTNHTATLGSKSVTAKKYGNVTLTTKTWAVEREHTGGGSK